MRAVWPCRDLKARERMDDPNCDPAALRNTYAQFQLVNAAISGWRRVYTRELRPLLREGPRTLLDIGCGGGDVPLSLARRARRDGLHLSVTAIDTDPRAIAYAQSRPHFPEVEFRRASSRDLLAEGRRFDFVISNHVLHHLSEIELRDLLDDSLELGRLKVIHADIERGPLAYALFSAFTLPFFHRSYIREDGLTSIRRSFTHAELSAAAPAGWQARRMTPFRNLLVYDRG